MADILPFNPRSKRAKKEQRQSQAQRKTLCKRGFHKWAVDQRKQFDVKQGKLITIHKCSFCGATKTTAD